MLGTRKQKQQKKSSYSPFGLCVHIEVDRDWSYAEWLPTIGKNANAASVTLVKLRYSLSEGSSVRTELLPDENFVSGIGTIVDLPNKGNCGVDALGLGITYLQSIGSLPDVHKPISASSMRSKLRAHARSKENIFKDYFGDLAETKDWYKHNIVDALYTPGQDYRSDLSESQWLESDYACPVVADLYKVEICVYDLQNRSTTTYAPNSQKTRRRPSEIVCCHHTRLERPSAGSVVIMMYKNHFYWLMPCVKDCSAGTMSILRQPQVSASHGSRSAQSLSDAVERNVPTEYHVQFDEEEVDLVCDENDSSDCRQDNSDKKEGKEEHYFNGNCYASYKLMVKAKREFNQQFVERIGILEAAEDIRGNVAASNKAKKIATKKARAKESQRLPTRRSTRIASTNSSKCTLDDEANADHASDCKGTIGDYVDEGINGTLEDEARDGHASAGDKGDVFFAGLLSDDEEALSPFFIKDDIDEEGEDAGEVRISNNEVPLCTGDKRRGQDRRPYATMSAADREKHCAKSRDGYIRQTGEQRQKRREQGLTDNEKKQKRKLQKAVAERKRWSNMTLEKRKARNQQRRERRNQQRREREDAKRKTKAAVAEKGQGEGEANASPPMRSGSLRLTSKTTAAAANATPDTSINVGLIGRPESTAGTSAETSTANVASSIEAAMKQVRFSRKNLGINLEQSTQYGYFAVSAIAPNSEAERRRIEVGDVLFRVGARHALFSHQDDIRNFILLQARPLALTIIPKDKASVLLLPHPQRFALPPSASAQQSLPKEIDSDAVKATAMDKDFDFGCDVGGTSQSEASDLTNTLARTSILNDDHKASSPNVVPQPDEDDDMLPFDDDGDDDRPLPPADEESLGLLDDADSSIHTRRNSSMGGLNEDTRSLGPSPKQKHKKRASVTGPKRMRKRRKIVIDNDSTELSNDHIRNMLKNTSDIVLANLRHPSDWTSDDEKKKEDERPSRLVDLRSVLPPAKLLARPHLGDDGTLAPALLEVWYRNTAPLLGKPTPFRMRGAQHVMDQAAHAEEVEIGRQGQQRDSTDHDVATPPFDEDGSDMPLPQDDEEEDMVVPFDDADDEPPAHEGGEGLATADSPGSIQSRGSGFSLGLDNEYHALDEAADPRQEAGSDLVSSTSKWHKHTVQVLAMLQRNMKANAEVEEAEPKPTCLSFDKLSAGCSRRTAASVFFELLQLKTWDFLELDQDESYGDIKIAPGLKFNDGPPSN